MERLEGRLSYGDPSSSRNRIRLIQVTQQPSRLHSLSISVFWQIPLVSH